MNDRHDPDTAGRLRAALDHLTQGVSKDPPGLDAAVAETSAPSVSSRRRWALMAAAAVTIVGAAGIVWVAGTGDETPVAEAPAVPSTDPPGTLVMEPPDSVVAEGSVPDSSIPSGPVEIVATVLESPDYGPQLCSEVLTSYPPQCGGPDITNWDWSTVEFEEANGTRWGEYLLTGSYELVDGTFTVEGPVRPPSEANTDGHDPDFTTPCPAPTGGWPEMSLGEFVETDFSRLERVVEGFAGLWVDEPNRVVNVRVTDDRDAATAAIAELFDGGICVSGADYTMAELTDIQSQIPLEENVVATLVDIMLNRVVVEVRFPDPELEQQLAEQFGERVVVRSGATPAEGRTSATAD